MTIQALYSAATGMNAMETKLDVISNNLANLETTAYKKDRANFEDLFYRHEKLPGSQDSAGQYTPMGIAIGLGVRNQSIQSDFVQGAFKQTGNQLDIAIDGPGFLQVMNPPTAPRSTPAPAICRKTPTATSSSDRRAPAACWNRRFKFRKTPRASSSAPEGQVSVQQPGNNQLQIVGQIQLATFVNSQGLMKMGENLYQGNRRLRPADDQQSRPTTASAPCSKTCWKPRMSSRRTS